MRVCIVYLVRKLCHSRGLGQLMGVAVIERTLEIYRPAKRKLLVAYVETGTNS